MVARNFLYNNVSDEVKKELNARARAQGAVNRTTHTHNWSTRKMATAKVSNIDSDVVLAPPAKGGFTDLYSDTSRYVPDPVLTGVSLRNEGKMGSLQKATVSFTVFNRDQLDKYEPLFLTPGQVLKIDYGWSTSASDADVSKDSFEGLVYDFSMALNNFGGFECSVEVVGKGFKIFGIEAGATVKEAITSIDATSAVKLYSNLVDIIDLLKLNALKTNPSIKPGDVVKGFTSFTMNTALLPDTEGQSQETLSYITLGRFFEVVNTFIDKVVGAESEAKYICDTEFTVSQYDPKVVSADVRKFILPDKECGKYGTTIFSSDDLQFANGDIAQLNNILLHVDWLKELYTEMVKNNESVTINAFIKEIFRFIGINTGGIYNLTLITREDEGDSNIYIIDTNFTATTDDIIPYVFKAFRADSIVRNLSLDSKLPDKMATAMYIAGRGSNASGVNADVASHVTGADVEEPDESAIESLDTAVESLGTSGFETESISTAISALKKYKIYARDKNWNNDVLYPLNLSITIDGIAGLRFGNVIGTDWLPSKYRDKLEGLKVVFVIMTVEHTIASQNWTTTISTQCRMSL